MSDLNTDEVAQLLRVIADPTRLRILELLATSESGEICACDLPDELLRSQSTVSHHLSQLVNAGVILREQRGKWAWFRTDGPRLEAIRSALARLS